MNNSVECKNIGVDWIGSIPSNWKVSRFKHLFDEKKSTKNPELNSGSISFGQVIYKNDESIPESTKEGYQEVLEGEFLINPLNLNYDLKSLRIALSRINVVVSQGYIVLKLRDHLHPNYYEYLLRKFDVEHMKSLGQGVRQTISFTHLKDENLVVPPIQQQILISRYLDKKTSQIDSLVEKIQKKIELLKEQRTSLINHYVTKGLDPNVEMKDSGVEWIGEIPKHWDCKKLKYISKKISEKRVPVDGDIKISPENVESDTGRIMNFYSDYETEGQIFQNGDILFNKLRVYLNKVVLCEFDGLSMGEMIVVRPVLLENGFLYRVLNSSGFINQVNSLSEGVKLPRPSVSGIFDSYVPIPPREEQYEIYKIIKHKTDLLDRVVDKHTCQIDYIREYRQSLISSVVTGKVRVMEYMI
jgi:type I restriction enzyme S subunit